MIDKHFKKYKELITEIDSLADSLFSEHKNHVQCKKGCDQCCMDYSIFPIEYYSILNDLKKEDIQQKGDLSEKESCVFLKNHICTIYKHRPVICRTHGLPLLYMNDNSEWELSACELNFTSFNFEEFNFDNTFPQDKFNSQLFQLNKAFLENFSDKNWGEFDLIPLKNLVKEGITGE